MWPGANVYIIIFNLEAVINQMPYGLEKYYVSCKGNISPFGHRLALHLSCTKLLLHKEGCSVASGTTLQNLW
jgi:hypothetical protein